MTGWPLGDILGLVSQPTVAEAITNLPHIGVIYEMAICERQDGEQKSFDTRG